MAPRAGGSKRHSRPEQQRLFGDVVSAYQLQAEDADRLMVSGFVARAGLDGAEDARERVPSTVALGFFPSPTLIVLYLT